VLPVTDRSADRITQDRDDAELVSEGARLVDGLRHERCLHVSRGDFACDELIAATHRRAEAIAIESEETLLLVGHQVNVGVPAKELVDGGRAALHGADYEERVSHRAES